MATECPRCGKQNTQDRDFCECGEYLNWDPTGEHAPSAGAGATAPATSGPPAPTSAPPAPLPRTEALPAPVLLVLQHPGAPPGDGAPSLRLAAREPGVLEGVIRNQTEEVDSYALRVDGIPAEWVSIDRPSVDLLPWSVSASGNEARVRITITPPRDPDARAGRHPFRLEAVSRSTGAVAATAPGSLEILPFYEFALDAAPERRSGRRSVRFTVSVTSTSNAPVDVTLAAADPEEVIDATFDEHVVRVDPGARTTTRLTATPQRQRWFGRPVEHRLQLDAKAADAPPPPQRTLTYRQLTWIPWWVAPLALALIALLVALYLSRTKTATMPDVIERSPDDAALAIADAGFTQAPRTVTVQAKDADLVGRVVDQRPAANLERPRDAAIVLSVAVGNTKVEVPDVRDKTLDEALAILNDKGLELGTVESEAREGTVYRQQPRAGAQASEGTPVRVWLRAPDGDKTPTPTPTATTDPNVPSLEGLRTLAIARADGIVVDPPGEGDAFKLKAGPGDGDPAWFEGQVVFRRLVDDVGQLFAVDADENADPEPLTAAGEDWRSPAPTDAGLMAKRGAEICHVTDTPACLPVEGLYRIAAVGDQLVALAHAADGTDQVSRFTVNSDDPNDWDAPEDVGTVAGGSDIAISPDGAVVVSSGDGLALLEGDGEPTPVAPDISQGCGIDFLDATRLAVATGACETDPQIALVDIDSGKSRELEGDKGGNLAFEPE